MRFTLEDRETRTLSENLRLDRSDLRSWSIGRGPYGEEDEPDVLTLEIEAPDAQTARVAALHLLGDLRRRGGLQGDTPQIVWVARLDSQPASSMRFLEEAWSALGEEHPEWAVIAAQTHLEVHIRVLVEASAKASPSPHSRALLAMSGPWEPRNRRLRPMLEALWEVDFKRDCPQWSAYNTHVARRNAVIHGGQEIDEIEARQSVEAVVEVWKWLNTVANKLSAPPGTA